MRNRDLRPGDTVRHFKRGLLTPQELEREPDMYRYEIICIATHTETREELVVYRALYGDGGIYARPWDMFMSETDREKYPQAQQKYRFERE